MIGPCWLTATDLTGRRRIDDPEDWIRRELVEAFAAGVRVIPVLTDDAILPREAELPADIARLSRCQARWLRRREHVAGLARIAGDLIAVDEVLREAAAAHDAIHPDVVEPARWPLCDAVTADLLGVHRCAAATGLPRLPAYVPRDRDADLRNEVLLAAGTGGLVVVEGDSGAGKTRSAANVLHEVLGTWPVFVADCAGQVVAVTRAVSGGTVRPCVLWLDDLERFLGPDGLTPRVLDVLVGRRVVVLATLRSERHAAISRVGDDADAMVEVTVQPVAQAADLAERVLRRAAIVVYDRMWSEEEVSLALSVDDPRLDDAASMAAEYGIAEFLAAGPQILAECRRASAPGGHPRGAALVSAAVDLSRAGVIGDIPAGVIMAVHGHYLSQQRAHRLRLESVEDAWAWATSLRCGATSPLQPGREEGTFAAFDYLVDAAESDGEPVPEAVWQAALDFTADAPPDRYLVGLMAWRSIEPSMAEQAWIPLVVDGYGPAGFMLGQLYQRCGRVDDAERCFRVGIDGGYYRAAVNLAACYMRHGDLEQGVAWYRIAADNGDWLGAMNLAQIMRDRGDWRSAIRWYLRAFECGNTLDALHLVAAIYEEQGHIDLAEGGTRRP